ncbi:MAG: YdcF family protein [Acidobacteriota bacterium]|nr:YdcF family protein [Acidobacteriota bacterium]
MISSAMILFWVITAPFLANRLIVEKRIDKADVILVLSGSAAYSERTRMAAEVYRAGVSDMILLSDDGTKAGWSVAEERNPRFVELASRSLVEQGVDPDSIGIMDEQVSGTIDEAVGFAGIAGKKGWKSVLIVTSAYHSRRALNTFEGQLADTGIDVGIVSPRPGEDTPPAFIWWLSPKGWRLVAGEYLKSAYYWFFY